MSETVRSIRQSRMRMLVINLVYFAALLALGLALFIAGFVGGFTIVLTLALVAGYIAIVRPMTVRYKAALRDAILKNAVCFGMAGYTHTPNEGVSADDVAASGMIRPSAKNFYSRELITVSNGGVNAELADVTFPIVEGRLNAMFSGSFIRLSKANAGLPKLEVRAGELKEGSPTANQQKSIDRIGSLIPGSLYLSTVGDSIYVLLRGRFFGFKINPLMQVSEDILKANPYPELEESLRLFNKLSNTGNNSNNSNT